jgi:hypothetical protein
MKPGIWQTTRWHHSDVSIEAALLASDERLRMLGLTRDGKQLPLDQFRRELKLLHAHGYECVPMCNNVDAKGRCLGHEPEVKEPITPPA